MDDVAQEMFIVGCIPTLFWLPFKVFVLHFENIVYFYTFTSYHSFKDLKVIYMAPVGHHLGQDQP